MISYFQSGSRIQVCATPGLRENEFRANSMIFSRVRGGSDVLRLDRDEIPYGSVMRVRESTDGGI